jgi:hypothetical protein
MNMLRKEIINAYGENPEESPDYTRIININHYNRLSAVINQGKLHTIMREKWQKKFVK